MTAAGEREKENKILNISECMHVFVSVSLET